LSVYPVPALSIAMSVYCPPSTAGSFNSHALVRVFNLIFLPTIERKTPPSTGEQSIFKRRAERPNTAFRPLPSGFYSPALSSES
jgi:hypothetical protein